MIDMWRRSWIEFVLPGLPDRDPTTDLHDQRDRVAQRPVPCRDQATRALPQRAVRAESALPRGHRTSLQPPKPHRRNRRLESNPEHTRTDLRRPPRTQLADATYTKNRTDPEMRESERRETPLKWVGFASAAALPWARDCLSQGSEVARRLRDSLPSFTTAEVLLPTDWKGAVTPLNGHGRGLTLPDKGPALDAHLRQLLPDGAVMLVEDELRDATDPMLTDEYMVAGGRILHKVRQPRETWAAIAKWSSGYPLIAYSAPASWPNGEPQQGADLLPGNIEFLAEAVDLLVLGLFDMETLLILRS